MIAFLTAYSIEKRAPVAVITFEGLPVLLGFPILLGNVDVRPLTIVPITVAAAL